MNKFTEASLLVLHWFLNVTSVFCLVFATVGLMYNLVAIPKAIILICSYVLLAAAKLYVEGRIPDKSKIINFFGL